MRQEEEEEEEEKEEEESMENECMEGQSITMNSEYRLPLPFLGNMDENTIDFELAQDGEDPESRNNNTMEDTIRNHDMPCTFDDFGKELLATSVIDIKHNFNKRAIEETHTFPVELHEGMSLRSWILSFH